MAINSTAVSKRFGTFHLKLLRGVPKSQHVSKSSATKLTLKIDFKSIQRVGINLNALRINKRHIAGLVDTVYRQSNPRGLKISKAILKRDIGDQQKFQEAIELALWARDKTSQERQMVCKAFKQTGNSFGLIHIISGMKKSQARSYIQDYFRAGGSKKSIVEWLRFAGSIINKIRPRGQRTAGFGGWIKKVAGKIGDAIGGLADVVWNSIGKLADFVGDVLGLTIQGISEVAGSLLEAGETLGNILRTALDYSTEALKKFVKAVYSIGESVLEIVKWATSAGLNILRLSVKAIREYGGPLGKLLAIIPDLTVRGVKLLAYATFKAGYKTLDIFSYVANKSLDIIQTTLEGVFKAKLHFSKAILHIFKGIGDQFRVGFVKGLEALGHAPLKIFKAVVKLGLSYLALAYADFLIIWGGRKLTQAEKNVAKKVFGVSIDLDRIRITHGSIPQRVGAWLTGRSAPFTTMYVINLPKKTKLTEHLLIHELTHVWQGIVKGPVYMVESVHEQLLEGSDGAYEIQKLKIAQAENLLDLDIEEQAVVVESYYLCKFKGTPISDVNKLNIPCSDLENLAKTVYKSPWRRGVLERYLRDVPVVVGRQIPRRIN